MKKTQHCIGGGPGRGRHVFSPIQRGSAHIIILVSCCLFRARGQQNNKNENKNKINEKQKNNNIKNKRKKKERKK